MKKLNLKILAVEDHHEHATILTFAFRKAGMDISIARNGREAISLLSDLSFFADIIVIDYLLPDTDGIELMKHIRSMGVNLPVIMMTAYEDYGTAVKAYQAGVDDFLFKIENYHEVLPGLVLKVIKNNQLGITKQGLEQTLKEQYSQLETLFRESPNPILLFDYDKRFIDANPAALRFLETTKKELNVIAIEKLVHNNEIDPIALLLNHSAANNAVEFQFRIGSRIKTLLFYQVPVTFNSRKVACCIGHDITSEREMASILQKQVERWQY